MVKPPDLDKTFETFSHEVKDFYKSKTITFITWATFWILNISNVITVIYSATPSWAWTHEVVGAGSNDNGLEGEVYGFYGMWYICWNQVNPVTAEHRSCLLWAFADYMPDWFPAFQAMMTLTWIFGFTSFMLLGFYMFALYLNRSMRMITCFIASTFMAAICAITGFVVFVVLFLHDAWWCCHPDLKRELIAAELHWGFILGCIGTGLYMIAGVGGIFEALDILKERRYAEEFEEWRRREAQMEMEGFDPQMIAFMNPMNDGRGGWR